MKAGRVSGGDNSEARPAFNTRRGDVRSGGWRRFSLLYNSSSSFPFPSAHPEGSWGRRMQSLFRVLSFLVLFRVRQMLLRVPWDEHGI